MKNALLLAIKDIKKKPFFLILVFVQIIITGIVMMLALVEMPGIMKMKQQIDSLETSNVVVFKSYYRSANDMITVPEDVESELINVFDESRVAFSTTESYSYAIAEFPEYQVLIIIGVADSIYQLGDDSDSNETVAYIGSNLDEISLGTTLTFGGDHTIPVTVKGQLNTNDVYYYRTFEHSLDDMIVIKTSYQTMVDLFGHWFDQEIIQNANFIAPSTETLEHYVEIINKSRIMNVFPYTASQLYTDIYQSVLYNHWFFLIFFAIAFLFCLFGIFFSVMKMINSNLGEYAIHIIYGATKKDIYSRLFIYIIFVLAPPITALYLLCGIIGFFNNASFITLLISYISIMIASLVFLFMIPMYKLNNIDLQTMIRRDE